eukprot:4479413-Prymnesium_polylepis.1
MLVCVDVDPWLGVQVRGRSPTRWGGSADGRVKVGLVVRFRLWFGTGLGDQALVWFGSGCGDMVRLKVGLWFGQGWANQAAAQGSRLRHVGSARRRRAASRVARTATARR